MCSDNAYVKDTETRRTVVISDRLLEEAREALGTTGVRETIEAGLRQAVRRQKIEAARRLLGTLDLDITFEEIDELRAAE
jgi:Arc/MetJ family transcription regulator